MRYFRRMSKCFLCLFTTRKCESWKLDKMAFQIGLWDVFGGIVISDGVLYNFSVCYPSSL